MSVQSFESVGTHDQEEGRRDLVRFVSFEQQHGRRGNTKLRGLMVNLLEDA